MTGIAKTEINKRVLFDDNMYTCEHVSVHWRF